jgi:hypothetical protein
MSNYDVIVTVRGAPASSSDFKTFAGWSAAGNITKSIFSACHNPTAPLSSGGICQIDDF